MKKAAVHGEQNHDDDFEFLFAAKPERINKQQFPSMFNLSSVHFFQFVACPPQTLAPEFVFLPYKEKGARWTEESVMMSQWNLLWEAGQLRTESFEDELPDSLHWLKRYKGHNIYLLPIAQRHRYYAYSSLYHLLPERTLKRFGLPLLHAGTWPSTIPDERLGRYLPTQFNSILEHAFASHVWPLICSGSKLSAFNRTDPIKLMAHSLDFWLPHLFKAIENRLQCYGRVGFDSEEQVEKYNDFAKKLPDGVNLVRPLRGGDIWQGEEEAWEVTQEMVSLADAHGRLRDILDAVRSNRVEDDFSECWSYAREDFERKLYRKRSKIKISFVELDDTIPVHCPESEVHENLLWENFIALLEPKEKRIVVCLRNGHTRVGEISQILGYANHSPVSKALAKIRHKAVQYLEM